MAEHEQHHPAHDGHEGHHAGAPAVGGLKKKVGPLPLWAWLVIAGGTLGLIVYTRRNAASSTAASGTTVDPANPLGLTYAQEAADEAAGIDPNTGNSIASEQTAGSAIPTTSDAGGGGDGTSTPSGGTDDGNTPASSITGEISDITGLATALAGLEGALYPNGTNGTGTGTDGTDGTDGTAAPGGTGADGPAAPAGPAAAGTSTAAASPAVTLTALDKLTKGAIAAPFGSKKPTAPAGYTVRGLGSGNWEFVPKATPAPAKPPSPKPPVVTGVKKQTPTSSAKPVAKTGTKKS